MFLQKLYCNALILAVLFGAFCASQVNCEEVAVKDVGRQLLEQGRTFVHHAVKRLTFILPAIFFKLGIAFTLLILVTIAAVNNGFIGFMLLIVGLSTVLARMQEARTAATVHPVPLAAYSSPHYSHFLDRSDTVDSYVKGSSSGYTSSSPYTEVVYNKYNSY